MMQQQPMMMQPGMQQPMMMQPGMQQPMMMMQPGMQMMAPQGNFQIVQIKTGMEKLQELPGVFIKQKFDLLEALSGCELENKYAVYRLSKDGQDKKGKPFLKAKEKSSFCARQCLHPSCRPYEMKVENEDSNETIDGTSFMHIDRPFTCTFYCLARPWADVTLQERDANEYLGYAYAPFTCYDHQVDVYGAQEELKYKIIANCCQLGFFCKAPCDPCQHIHFEIKDSNGNDVGNLEKYSQGCIKASIDESSNFAVDFPKDASTKDKALLIAATLFLEIRFFEEKQESPQQNF